jgi:two-component system chemotaxis sensor kinase CheA
MTNIFTEYQSSFIEEAEEYISTLDENLLALEKEKMNKNVINHIFRVLHTLKSSAAAVGFNDLSRLSHKAEDLVQLIRNGQQKVNSTVIDTLLEVSDFFKINLGFSSKPKETEIDIVKVINKLDKMTGGSDKEKTEDDEIKSSVQEVEYLKFNEYQKELIKKEKKKGKNCFLLKIEIDPREQIKWLRAELILNKIKKTNEIINVFPDKNIISSPKFDGNFSVVVMSKEKSDTLYNRIMVDLVKNIIIEPVIDIEKEIMVAPGNAEIEIAEDERDQKDDVLRVNHLTTKSNTIRVPVTKLDNLMHFVGELVIANSGLKALENRVSDNYKDSNIYHELNFLTDKIVKISSDLQNGIMQTRMLPINTIFNLFVRIVRDLSKIEKKEIDLIINGEDTELDKTVIDEIGEPLMHLVRNAVDHGIETSSERIQKGKSPRGKIMLAASQAGNRILISVRDDGRGIDLEEIKNTAVKKGLLKKAAIDKMDEKEIFNLIFEPGFSTSKKVNPVSGRGIGLDVVVDVITGLGGSVDVNVEPGKGTGFNITLPLTLAISMVIIVESGGNDYALPISDIKETIKMNIKDIHKKRGMKAINLRNEVLPLVNLNEILENRKLVSKTKTDNQKVSIIVASYRDKNIGLIVDNIIGKQEIVLKPLETHFKTIKGVSGAAVLGDGSTILVIDIVGIMNILKDLEEARQHK